MKKLILFGFILIAHELNAQRQSFFKGLASDSKFNVIFFLATLVIIILIDLFLRARLTKYIIYEKRIDIKKGILFRTHQSCWLYEITNISYSRNPINLVTGDSTITIDADKLQYKLVGMKAPKTTNSKLSALKFMQSFFDMLRIITREERGRVKKIWI